jgi:hypothetical protein
MSNNQVPYRCPWVDLTKPDYIDYHDREWRVPVREDLLCPYAGHGNGQRPLVGLLPKTRNSRRTVKSAIATYGLNLVVPNIGFFENNAS